MPPPIFLHISVCEAESFLKDWSFYFLLAIILKRPDHSATGKNMNSLLD